MENMLCPLPFLYEVLLTERVLNGNSMVSCVPSLTKQ